MEKKYNKIIGRLNSIIRTPREQLIEQIDKTEAIKTKLIGTYEKSDPENREEFNALYSELFPQIRKTQGLEIRDGTILVKAFVKFDGKFDEIMSPFKVYNVKILDDLAIVEIPIDTILDILELPGIVYIEMDNVLQPTLADAINATGLDIIKSSHNGNGVLIGVIDDDIDCFNPLFRNGNQTRIIYYKDTSGNERTNVDIDGVLNGTTPRFATGSNTSHGTKVTAVAAGNGGVASEASIAFSCQSLFPSAVHVADAAWIMSGLTQGPCVIVASLGDWMGSHDGKSSVETWLEYLQRKKRVSVVFSSGNMNGQDQHIRGTVTNGNNHILALNPQGSTYEEIEIWYPGAGNLTVELRADGNRLIDPNGPPRTYLTPLGQNNYQIGETNGEEYIIDHHLSPTNNDYYINIIISSLIIATQTLEIILTDNGSGSDVEVDGWVSRAYWMKSGTIDTRDMITTTVPGTGRQTITVGSHVTDPPKHVDNESGRGTRDGRNKPEILTYTELGIAGLPTYLPPFGGTSASAPVVAGAIALLMECKGGIMSQPHVRACLRVKSDATNLPVLPVHAHGWGRLDASELCHYTWFEQLFVRIFTICESRL